MVNKKQLEQMESINIKGVDFNALPDIRAVKIIGKTSAERIESYLSQVGNPYCFRVGNTPVLISFNKDGKSIEDTIKSYFLALKS